MNPCETLLRCFDKHLFEKLDIYHSSFKKDQGRNVGGRLPVLIGIFETLSDAADIFMYYLGFFSAITLFLIPCPGCILSSFNPLNYS